MWTSHDWLLIPSRALWLQFLLHNDCLRTLNIIWNSLFFVQYKLTQFLHRCLHEWIIHFCNNVLPVLLLIIKSSPSIIKLDILMDICIAVVTPVSSSGLTILHLMIACNSQNGWNINVTSAPQIEFGSSCQCSVIHLIMLSVHLYGSGLRWCICQLWMPHQLKHCLFLTFST